MQNENQSIQEDLTFKSRTSFYSFYKDDNPNLPKIQSFYNQHLNGKKNLQQICYFKDHASDVNQVINMKQNLQCIASCSEKNKQIKIFDIVKQKHIKTLSKYDMYVFCITSLPKKNIKDNDFIVCGCNDNGVNIWNINSQKAIQIGTHKDKVFCLASLNEYYNQKINIFVSGSLDNLIKLWQFDYKNQGSEIQSKEIDSLKGHRNAVRCLDFIDNHQLISGSYDSTIKIWDIELLKYISTFIFEHGYVMTVKKMEHDNNIVASGGVDSTISLWDLRTGKRTIEFQGHQGVVNSIATLKEKYLVSGGDDGNINIWDLTTNNLFYQLHAHQDWIRSLCSFQFDSNYYLASAGRDQLVQVWRFNEECKSSNNQSCCTII